MAQTKRVRLAPDFHELPEWLTDDLRQTLIAAGILQHHGRGTTVDTADSSSLATSKTLAKALADAFAAHGADTDLHVAADATLGTLAAAYASTPNEPADLTEVQDIANELKTELNLHIALAASHLAIGGRSAGVAALTLVTTTDAINQGTADALLNELKACFNRHASLGMPDFVVD